jgi:hypothetical protein
MSPNVDRRHQYAACAASEGCSLPLNLARITARIRIRFSTRQLWLTCTQRRLALAAR